jgi:hypothetical protein
MTDAEQHDLPQQALRLVFEYEGDEVKLVSQQRVAMLVPPGDTRGGEEERAGFRYEVQDREGRALYRRAARNPIRTDMEVFGPEPGSFTHVETAEPRGVFTLLIPDLEEAHTLALVAGSAEPEQAARGPREIARFNLSAEPPRRESK